MRTRTSRSSARIASAPRPAVLAASRYPYAERERQLARKKRRRRQLLAALAVACAAPVLLRMVPLVPVAAVPLEAAAVSGDRAPGDVPPKADPDGGLR